MVIALGLVLNVVIDYWCQRIDSSRLPHMPHLETSELGNQAAKQVTRGKVSPWPCRDLTTKQLKNFCVSSFPINVKIASPLQNSLFSFSSTASGIAAVEAEVSHVNTRVQIESLFKHHSALKLG